MAKIVKKPVSAGNIDEIRAKILAIIELINKRVIGMPEVVRGVFLAMLSGQNERHGEHMFMIGPPGVGKSYVMDVATSCIELSPQDMFDYLFHPFSVVDELVGPTDLDAMFPAATFDSKYAEYAARLGLYVNENPTATWAKKGFSRLNDLCKQECERLLSDEPVRRRVHRRDIDGYLPSATFAILDEIWKSGPASTSLFKITNERRYRNGNQMVDCPLITALTASNEYPVNKMDAPLWDRLLFRYLVEPVWDYEGQRLIQQGHRMTWSPDKLTLPEIYAAKRAVQRVVIPEPVEKALFDIHLMLAKKEIKLSNRRRNAMYNVIRASAFLCGKDEADVTDVASIWPCCWEHDSQIKGVRQLIIKVTNRGLDRLMSLSDVAASLFQTASPLINAYRDSGEPKALSGNGDSVKDIEEKMSAILDEVRDILAKADAATRAEGNALEAKVASYVREVLPYSVLFDSINS